jgi:hypothetical protein
MHQAPDNRQAVPRDHLQASGLFSPGYEDIQRGAEAGTLAHRNDEPNNHQSASTYALLVASRPRQIFAPPTIFRRAVAGLVQFLGFSVTLRGHQLSSKADHFGGRFASNPGL